MPDVTQNRFIMKYALLLAAALFVALSAYTQTDDPRLADAKTPLDAVPRITLPEQDNDALRAAELTRRQDALVPPRFAETIEVNISPATHGLWEYLPNGQLLWRLRILSPKAHSLNLGFQQYRMPAGGTLLLYSPDRKRFIGPFSTADNEAHGQLWTPVLPGEEIVLEVQMPENERTALQLHLKTVHHDFMGFSELLSGACNLDVVCGAADGWEIVDRYRDAIQSVAVYGFGGTTFCTGVLVNNTQNDCKPYFITANHCGVSAANAPSMVVYWNFQQSICREIGTPISGGIGDGSLSDFNTGAILRANYALTDVTLVELDDPVSVTANAYFAGWSRSPELPADTVLCVHHPGTEEKRISFQFDGVYTGERGTGPTPVPGGNYLIVAGWDVGTTEGGSSGAPLFDKEQRIIGQLFGGSASCNNRGGYDAFGWFRSSWNGGNNSTSRLRDWLDPAQSDRMQMSGRRQSACAFTLLAEAPYTEVCIPQAPTFQITVSEAFTAPVQLTVNGLPNGASAAFSMNPATPGSVITLTINNLDGLDAGIYNFQLEATDGLQRNQIELTFALLLPTGLDVVLQTPFDEASSISVYPDFQWETLTAGTVFQLQIARDSLFTDIVADLNALTVNSWNNTLLDPLRSYFWRVRASNQCATGEWSAVRRFFTADVTCASAIPTDLPKEIVSFIPTTVHSDVQINLPGDLVSIRINNLDIRHTWVGDLRATLIAPSGRSVRLFDRPGSPEELFGCNGENLNLSFRDNAPNSANDLENTCSDRPAIAGIFEPLDPFSLLYGSPATGNWRLRVQDFEAEDGGALLAWNIEVCTVRPRDIGVRADTSLQTLCIGQGTAFPVTLGTDFANTGVRLSANGQPSDATVSFEPNPAQPGDTVWVRIDNLTERANLDLTIIATDGRDTANTEIEVIVKNSPPTVTLLFPNDGSQNIPLSTSLEWTSALDADLYIIRVEGTTGALLLTDTVTVPFYFLSNLAFGTTYQWQVAAINGCGQSTPTVATFTTIPDLSFAATPPLLTACPANQPFFNLTIGPGYGTPTTLRYEVIPNQEIPITFNVDANNVPPGSTVRAMLTNLQNLPPDDYRIRFQVSDGTFTNQDEVLLRLRSTPALTTLLTPADGTSTTEQSPTLSWGTVPFVATYRVEVATDDRFSNIVRSAALSDTSYTVQPALGGGVYYWRVTATNDCGFSTSGIFDFFIEATGIHYWQGQSIRFQPNPTGGMVSVQFSQPLSGLLQVELFSMQGQLLQRQGYEQPSNQIQFDLSAYPAGLYIVRLRHGQATLSQRIIKQDRGF